MYIYCRLFVFLRRLVLILLKHNKNMRIVKTIALELDRIFLFAQNRGARGQKMICDINWGIRRFMTKMRFKSEVVNYF